MKTWKKYAAGLAAAAGLTPGLWAQVPVASPAPVPAVPVAAPPQTLWSFLGLSAPQRAACKERICATPIGQLMNNALKPVSAFSGGLISGCCPPFPAADLLKPPGSAEGAAARIKADEADAKARREAVRYLGTVDCHYWPEAQDALANALRADRNECVRYEAALALGNGCCCTKVTIEALSIAVSGSTRDGNPSETSDRVRFAAQSALDGCLARLAPTPLPLEAPPVKGKSRGVEPTRGAEPVPTRQALPGAASANDYYKRVGNMPAAQVLANARKALATAAPARTGTAIRGTPRGEGGLVGLVSDALNMTPGAVDAPAPHETQRVVAESSRPPMPAGAVRPASFSAPAPAGELRLIPVPAPAAPPAPPVKAFRQPVPEAAVRPASFSAPTPVIESRPAPSPAPASPAPAAKSSQQAKPASAVRPALFTAPVPAVESRPTSAKPPAAATMPRPTASLAAATPPSRPSAPVTDSHPAASPAPVPAVEPRPTLLPPLPAPSPPPPPRRTVPLPPVSLATNTGSSFFRPAPAPAPTMTVERALPVLKSGTSFLQREEAARSLAAASVRTHPEVVNALMTAARGDSAPLVRAQCVRSLVGLGLGLPHLEGLFQQLMHDPDPRVKNTVEEAMAHLAARQAWTN